MIRFVHLHAAIALLAGAMAGCSGDEPSSLDYTISYVNGDQSQPNFQQASVDLDEDAASLRQTLAFGGGTLDAAPREASRYEIKIVDTDGTTAKLITCEVDEVASGQQTFDVPLVLGGSYSVSILTDRASCSAAP
jgi:hypothetical protein